MTVHDYGAYICWVKAIELLAANGEMHDSRNGQMKEIRGFQLVNLNPRDSLATRGGKVSIRYATTELLWYLSRRDDVEPLVKVAPQYANFANDGVAKGAYGKRWASNATIDQLALAMRLLDEKQNTRQAIVTMWQADDLIESVKGEWRDIPCTISLQFLVRNGDLDLIATMRSNDAWLGLPYDMFCFCEIQVLMAAALNLGVGKYVHQAGSLHVYEKDFAKTMSAARSPFYGHVRNIAHTVPRRETAAKLVEGADLLVNDAKAAMALMAVDDLWLRDILAGAIGMKCENDFIRDDFRRAIRHKEYNDANS